MQKADNFIGIDCGTNTGIAVWNVETKSFDLIKTCSILEALKLLEIYLVFGKNIFCIENPNLRKWFGKSGREKLQGAGSIKRDFAIWKEWLTSNNCEFIELAPKDIKTKMSADQFKKYTGVSYKTSQHARDAAMMVFMRK